MEDGSSGVYRVSAGSPGVWRGVPGGLEGSLSFLWGPGVRRSAWEVLGVLQGVPRVREVLERPSRFLEEGSSGVLGSGRGPSASCGARPSWKEVLGVLDGVPRDS